MGVKPEDEELSQLIERLRASAEPTMPVRGEPYSRTLWRGVRKTGSPTDEGMFGKGTYYTTNRDYAVNYSLPEGKVVEHHITLKNPYVAHGGEVQALGSEIFSKALREGKGYPKALELKSQYIRDTLEGQGYDGIVMPMKNPNTGFIHSEVVVFYPEKSIFKVASPVEPKARVASSSIRWRRGRKPKRGTKRKAEADTSLSLKSLR